VFVAPPPDPRLRRAVDLRSKGGLRNGPPFQASLERVPFLDLDLAARAEREASFRAKKRTLGAIARERSRTPASKWGSAEQARLQSGDPRSSPGTPRRTGRREASCTAVPRPNQTYRSSDSRSCGSCGSWLKNSFSSPHHQDNGTHAWWQVVRELSALLRSLETRRSSPTALIAGRWPSGS
jgi:hypothetical protein